MYREISAVGGHRDKYYSSVQNTAAYKWSSEGKGILDLPDRCMGT